MNSAIVLDPLAAPELASDVLEIWRRFGSYGQYSNEGFSTQFAPELSQRYDAAINFVRTGGRFGRREDTGLAAARTNYFRETWAYGPDVAAPGIEPIFGHQALLGAAQKLYGRAVIEPAIVYANVLLPGQELAVHTDVPEFRGANRKIVPQWLIVVMHHSGLFERWRMPIATAVTYFGTGEARGGALAYYPDGADGPPATFEPRHNTGIVLDTDSVFHGVDRVEGDEAALPLLRSGMRLVHDGDGRWSVRDGERVVAEYAEDELRLSVSWKAYCFADEAERAAWASHDDDLTLDTVLAVLVDDLVTRRVLASADDRPSDVDLAKLLIADHIKFPEPAEP